MTQTVAETTATKTTPFRVFKYDENANGWFERSPLLVEGVYPYVTAETLGRHAGAGEFMYFDAESDYPAVKFMVVVPETHYREAEGES